MVLHYNFNFTSLDFSHTIPFFSHVIYNLIVFFFLSTGSRFDPLFLLGCQLFSYFFIGIIFTILDTSTFLIIGVAVMFSYPLVCQLLIFYNKTKFLKFLFDLVNIFFMVCTFSFLLRNPSLPWGYEFLLLCCLPKALQFCFSHLGHFSTWDCFFCFC